jgi:hypothetical protein
MERSKWVDVVQMGLILKGEIKGEGDADVKRERERERENQREFLWLSIRC